MELGRLIERYFGPVVLTAFALATVLGLIASATDTTTVHGAGATFPAPLYARWTALYERERGTEVIYEPVGSGRGIEAIVEREVAFGATDARLSEDELADAPAELLQIPMALGAVAVVYHLPELERELVLDGSTLAAIYRGDIDRWDHPAVVALNPGIELPDRPIRVTHRSDSSGTSFVFTDYLSQVDTDWARTIGPSRSPDWPVGAAGAGNDGVAQMVLARPGGIGYVEQAYAENTGISIATLVNRRGEQVRPTAEAVQAAERSAPADQDGSHKPSLVGAPGEGAYPLASFTYIVVYRHPTHLDTAEAEALVDFLRWALTDGQGEAAELGYSPVPVGEATRWLTALDSIVVD